MPVLKNARHERFAQELAKGATATKAYELAGYKPHDGNAATLRGKQSVLDRVAELQGEIASKMTDDLAMTKDDVLKELAILAKATIAADNIKANDKRAACVDYARVKGWLIERHEHGDVGEFEALNNDQLEAWLEKRMESAGMIEAEPESKTEH